MKKFLIVLVVLVVVSFFFLQDKQDKGENVYKEESVKNTETASSSDGESGDGNEQDDTESENEDDFLEDDTSDAEDVDQDDENTEEEDNETSEEKGEEDDSQEADQAKNEEVSEGEAESILDRVELEGENLWGRETATTAIKELEDSGILLEEDVTGYLAHYYEPDRYEIGAKENRQFVGLYLKDEDGKAYEGVYKAFALDDESILYVLSAYTNYFQNGRSIQNLEYEYEVPLQGEYYEEVESGAILVADNQLYVLMADGDSKLDHFLDIFQKSIATNGTFDEYLQTSEAQSLLEDINTRFDAQVSRINAYDQKVPRSFKNTGLAMWDAYLLMDTDALKNFYADEVWFYASADEWFNDAKKEGVYDPKKFHLLERNKLLSAYKELKTEEAEELLPLLKGIKNDITFYYIEDLMELCDGEDKEEFPAYIKAEEKDVVMFVEMGPGNNNVCSINGKFSFNEKYFWLLRNINGSVKVVTDYNE